MGASPHAFIIEIVNNSIEWNGVTRAIGWWILCRSRRCDLSLVTFGCGLKFFNQFIHTYILYKHSNRIMMYIVYWWNNLITIILWKQWTTRSSFFLSGWWRGQRTFVNGVKPYLVLRYWQIDWHSYGNL